MSTTPTQDFVRQLMEQGRWPATAGEVLDPASLSPNQKLYIEWYMREEQIVQQKRTNRLLEQLIDVLTPKKSGKK